MFPGGVMLRHVAGDTYESVTIDGKHLQYFKAEAVDYAATLAEQQIMNRSKPK
jgi:hypothetical protein